jgi:hypothetical protein
VRLAQRGPGESAAVGTHATDTRSSPIVNWAAGFGRDLTARHPDVPEVASFRRAERGPWRGNRKCGGDTPGLGGPSFGVSPVSHRECG